MLCGQKPNQNVKKQKQYYNNSIKTLKVVHIKKYKKKINFLKDSSLVSACPLVQKVDPNPWVLFSRPCLSPVRPFVLAMTSHFCTLGSSLAVHRPASFHLDSSSRTFALIGPLCPPWRRPPSRPLWSPLPLRADKSMGCQHAITLSRAIAWTAPVVESLGSFIKTVEYLMYLYIFFYIYKNAESEFLPGAGELPVWMTGWLVVLGILRQGSGESSCCFSVFQWLPYIIFTLFFSWPEDTIFHFVCSFCEVGLNGA